MTEERWVNCAAWCRQRHGHKGLCDPARNLERALGARIRAARDLRDQEVPYREIARRLGLSASGVRVILGEQK